MTEDDLKVKSWKIYQEMIENTGGSLLIKGESVCRWLCEWLDEGIYKRFWNKHKQRWYGKESFSDFLEADPPEGLRLDRKRMWEDLEVLAAKSEHARRVMAAWAGQDAKVKQPGMGRPKKTEDKCDNITLTHSDRGTSRSYRIRRLARDRPDLLAEVEAGRMSVHAAAKEAGWVKPKKCPHCGKIIG